MDDANLPECRLCALGNSGADRLPADKAIAIVSRDQDVVTLVQFGVPGVFLAPRRHIATLSVLPDQSAAMLAALQRTVAEVRSSSAASGAMIEPSTDVPGAPGHVCYHVVPTLPNEGELGAIETLVAHHAPDATDTTTSSPLQPALQETGQGTWPLNRLQGLAET